MVEPGMLIAPKGLESHPAANIEITTIILVPRKNYRSQRNAEIGCGGNRRFHVCTKDSEALPGLQAEVMRKCMGSDFLSSVRPDLVNETATEVERIIVFVSAQDLHIQIRREAQVVVVRSQIRK